MPILAGMGCVVALPPAVLVLLDAIRAQEIAVAFADPSHTGRGDVLERYFDTPPKQLSTSAAANLAELAIEEAVDARNAGLRDLYLRQAETLLDYVISIRPDWSIAQILTARLEVARNGKLTPEAIIAFARSYRTGPFLWREARWRVAFASLCWPALAPATRNAVINEAVWLVRYDGGKRAEIEQLLGDSPAAVSFQLKLARPSSHWVG